MRVPLTKLENQYLYTTYYIHLLQIHAFTFFNLQKHQQKYFKFIVTFILIFFLYFALPVFHFRDKVLCSKYFKLLISYPHAVPSGGASHKKLFAQIHINETGVFAVGCLRRRAKLQGCDFLLLFWFNLAPDFLGDGSLSQCDPRPPIKWNYNFPFFIYVRRQAGRLWKQMENNMWVALAALCHVTMRQRPRLNLMLLKMCLDSEYAICTQDFYPVNQILRMYRAYEDFYQR